MKKPKVGRPAKPPGKFLFQILDFVGGITCFRVATRYYLAVTQRQPLNAKETKMTTTQITKTQAMKLSSRFHRGSQNEAIAAAVKSSAKTGQTRFVFPTAIGFQVVNSIPPSFVSFFKVDWANDNATVELIG